MCSSREHGCTYQDARSNTKPIIVEDDCRIAANVTFLGGAHVAHGSIVGRGVVGNKRYPPFSIITGGSAVVSRSRLTADACVDNCNALDLKLNVLDDWEPGRTLVSRGDIHSASIR